MSSQINVNILFSFFGINIQQECQGINQPQQLINKFEEMKIKAKATYKKLVFEHHPDKNGGDDTKIKEINNLWDILQKLKLQFIPPPTTRIITIIQYPIHNYTSNVTTSSTSSTTAGSTYWY